MNILILSCGTRVKLVQYFLQRENGFEKVVVTDCSNYAPALYVADKYYIVPKMTEPDYLKSLLEICEKEQIKVVLPLQEDELLLIAKERKQFEDLGILVAVSEYQNVLLCKDKYEMYQFLNNLQIPTIKTELVDDILESGNLDGDVFVKPRRGAGSVGAMRVATIALLSALQNESENQLIVQPYIKGTEYGIDIYVDFISKKTIGIFCKKKLRMRAGETEKSISVKIPEIEELVKKTIEVLHLRGPIDMDILEDSGKYYILEINPRFGGGYPHAYECGINFPKMLAVNAKKMSNDKIENEYKEGIIALKYSDVKIVKRDE